MSGICGIVHFDDRPIDPTHLHNMTAAAPHRGPDGIHHYRHRNVALAHLALHLTPEDTHQTQPLTAPNHRYVITADARLDNRDDLIPLLRAKRHLHPHDPPSDADIILAAYLTWGTDCPTHLIGDYAFAIWDAHQHQLLAARDPMAMRPLYYRTPPQQIHFASEIKQLLAVPGTPRQLFEPAVAAHLAGPYGRHEWTFFEGIHQLPPGHALLANDHGTRTWRTWDIDPDHHIHYRHEHQYVEHFRALFTQAVRTRLRTHKPIGLMLSGGMDSGSIASTAGWLIHHGTDDLPPLRTYTWAFDVLKDADERHVSTAITKHYGLISEAIVADQLWPLRDYPLHGPDLDEPGLAVYSALFDATLARARSDGVAGVIVGDRGDEVVGDWVFDDWGMFRALAWRELARSIRTREGALSMGLARRLRRRARSVVRIGEPSGIRATCPPWIEPAFADRADLPAIIAGTPDAFDPRAAPRIQRRQRILSFAGAMNARVAERRHAAHEVALLDPWADRRLIEFVAATPPWIVNRPHRPKHIAREAMAGVMPDAARREAGKSIPNALYDLGLRTRERRQIKDLIDSSVAAGLGFLVRERLRAAYDAYVQGQPSPHDLWWPLTLEMWLRAHGDSDGCT